MPDVPLSPEMEDLLERAAALRRGLAFLHLAPLETAAITLAVDARLVEEARRMLDDPATHAPMIEAFKAIAARVERDPLRAAWRDRTLPDAPPPEPLDAEDLVLAAERHPLGLPFLAEAPPETVAVVFGVHPFVVLEARGILEERKVPHPAE